MKIDRLSGLASILLYFGSFVYVGFWIYYQKQMTETWQLITFIPFGLFSMYIAYAKMKK